MPEDSDCPMFAPDKNYGDHGYSSKLDDSPFARKLRDALDTRFPAPTSPQSGMEMSDSKFTAALDHQ